MYIVYLDGIIIKRKKWKEKEKRTKNLLKKIKGGNLRDEDPEFFSTDQDPDPAQLKKNSGSDSGSDLKSK